jgi:hypothetical protein
LSLDPLVTAISALLSEKIALSRVKYKTSTCPEHVKKLHEGSEEYLLFISQGEINLSL